MLLRMSVGGMAVYKEKKEIEKSSCCYVTVCIICFLMVPWIDL